MPTGPDWLHEVKYDGYRMMLIREQDSVRLISSGGFNWARRFPRIVEAAMTLRQSHFILDGEAVVLDTDGVSDFAALHKHSEQAQLCAFDMLAGDGEDHRQLTLALRKANLDRLLSRPVEGIFLAHYEQGEIGRDLFRAACRMSLEGIVSKHRGRAYSGGKTKHWVKVKNRAHPAYSRVKDARLRWATRR